MARLVRQRKTYYVDAGGKRVPKGTPGAVKKSELLAKWYGQGIPGLPVDKRVPLATHKRVAEKMLADLVEKAERGVHGLPDKDAGRQPLAPLVAEFEQAVGRKAGEKHTKFVVLNVNRVLAGCGLNAVGDLLAAGLTPRVEAFVHGLTGGDDPMSGVNAATVGKHARQFTRWLWRKRKAIDHDPLAGVDLPSQATAGKRRALSPAELATLIDAANASTRPFRDLTGPMRAALYLTAAATGFRAGELAVVTPAHVRAEVPSIRLSAEETKNGKEADQPIPPAVVNRLAPLLASTPPAARLWPGSWWERAADMFRDDMAEAGLAVVVGGEEAVFHSLRHTYGTMLGRSAPIKVVQELARHSTPVLTIGRYGHTDMSEKAEAVNALPLPGSAHAGGPFAGCSRPDLERYAEAVTLTLAALTGVVLDTRRDTREVEPAGDTGGHSGTEAKKRGRGKNGRKG